MYLDIAVTLKYNQGHWIRFEWVKLNEPIMQNLT